MNIEPLTDGEVSALMARVNALPTLQEQYDLLLPAVRERPYLINNPLVSAWTTKHSGWVAEQLKR